MPQAQVLGAEQVGWRGNSASDVVSVGRPRGVSVDVGRGEAWDGRIGRTGRQTVIAGSQAAGGSEDLWRGHILPGTPAGGLQLCHRAQMTFAISCPKCIRYFLSVRSRLCWAESPGLAEWWPYGSPHVGTRRVAPPYSVLWALMPSPTPTHEALLRPGAEAWQVKVRALVLPSPSTPRCSTHTVSCRLLTVESVTLTKGWKLPEDSLQPKELPFPPVLRHPSLHPPGPAGDSITVALVQTDPPVLSLPRLAHPPAGTSFLRPHPDPSLCFWRQPSPQPSPVASPLPLLTPMPLGPHPQLPRDQLLTLPHTTRQPLCAQVWLALPSSAPCLEGEMRAASTP